MTTAKRQELLNNLNVTLKRSHGEFQHLLGSVELTNSEGLYLIDRVETLYINAPNLALSIIENIKARVRLEDPAFTCEHCLAGVPIYSTLQWRHQTASGFIVECPDLLQHIAAVRRGETPGVTIR